MKKKGFIATHIAYIVDALFKRKFSFHLLLLTIATSVILADICSYQGELFWFFDILASFKVQYFLLLILSSLILLFFYRMKRTALFFLLYCLIILWEFIPFFIHNTSDQQHSLKRSETFKCISFNVLRANGNYRAVKEFIMDEKPDFLFLQEVDTQWLSELAPIKKYYPYSITEPRDDNFGIAMFSTLPFNESTVWYSNCDIPAIFAKVTIEKRELAIIALHTLPPKNGDYMRIRNHQLSSVAAKVAALDNCDILVAGDMNTTAWSIYFRHLLSDSGLRDSSYGFGIQPTWPAFKVLFPLLVPIDHILISEDIDVVERRLGPNMGSDHYPIIMDFNLESIDYSSKSL